MDRPRWHVGAALALAAVWLLAGCAEPKKLSPEDEKRRQDELKEYYDWQEELKAKEAKKRAEESKKQEAAARRKKAIADNDKRFASYWPKFLAQYRRLGASGATSGDGHLRGKAAILDANSGKEGPVDLLPVGARASVPEDVKTLVVLSESRSKVGSYTSGGDAIVLVWTVTIIDWERGSLVAAKTFRGGAPPHWIQGASGATGVAPAEAVREHLAKLPRRG